MYIIHGCPDGLTEPGSDVCAVCERTLGRYEIVVDISDLRAASGAFLKRVGTWTSLMVSNTPNKK